MRIDTAQDAIAADPRLADADITWHRMPAVAPRFAPWPPTVSARVVAAVHGHGVDALYTHQAATIEGAVRGHDQVVVTPTASGKTLCYTVPVLQAVLDDPSSRALYIFPTKALAQDQLDELHGLVTDAGIDLKTFTYDGDTSPNARRQVRTAGQVVLTNFDMLHTGILPHHTQWVRLFENLRYVVIDELHSYRGVFGSHVANVIRRLRRISRFYGSDPVFICCSATIANAGELATGLIGREVTVVDDNGAPRGERIVGLVNPPVVNRELGLRRGVVNTTVDVVSHLQEAGVQTLVFAGSRSRVEELTQYLRELPSGQTRPGEPDRVSGYRSGYLPRERRAIESALREQRVRTVVSTNALELGIDIGGLDAVVVAGYPGTLASTWQQLGRAGRRHDAALSILIASSSPLDQYVVGHPEYLFGQPVEAARINPDNEMIAAEHLKCAVFELPLEASEHALLGTRTAVIADALAETGMVHLAQGRAYWSSEAFPAHETSLRTGADQNVVIIETGAHPRVIGEVDRPSAMTLVHEDAIYVHDGRQYHVDTLDWEELKAYVRPVDVDYYTDAHLAVELRVLEQWDVEDEPAPRAHGEVAITYLATIFKKVRLHTHENVGWGKVRLPQDDLHTAAWWLTVPSDTGPVRATDAEGMLLGLGELLRNVAPLLLMCDARDLQLATQVKSPHTGLPTVFLWESVPGGIGLSEQLHAETDRLLEVARGLVTGCPCSGGCPGCVGPPVAPGLGVKDAVVRVLQALTTGAPTETSA